VQTAIRRGVVADPVSVECVVVHDGGLCALAGGRAAAERSPTRRTPAPTAHRWCPWSHDGQTGGPRTVAKPAETGPITVAGDNCGSMVASTHAYGPISAAPPVISARLHSEDQRLDIADSHRIGVVASASFLNRKSALTTTLSATRNVPAVGARLAEVENWRGGGAPAAATRTSAPTARR
jgi:hypothetical protein